MRYVKKRTRGRSVCQWLPSRRGIWAPAFDGVSDRSLKKMGNWENLFEGEDKHAATKLEAKTFQARGGYGQLLQEASPNLDGAAKHRAHTRRAVCESHPSTGEW